MQTKEELLKIPGARVVEMGQIVVPEIIVPFTPPPCDQQQMMREIFDNVDFSYRERLWGGDTR